MKNFLGQNGFVWWFGIVEDINDPVQLGRVRVRCIGWHTDDKDKIPTDSLPWAIPMFDVQSASTKGVGTSPTGLLVGSWVLGFFIDGNRAQEPAILASISGSHVNEIQFPDLKKLLAGFTSKQNANGSVTYYDSSGEVVVTQSASIFGLTRYVHAKDNPLGKKGTTTVTYVASGVKVSKTLDTDTGLEIGDGTVDALSPFGESRIPDVNALARGTQTKPYTPDSKISEPSDPFNAQYPYNKVMETLSGHVKEYDDTPDKERIRELHKSGTFYQVHPDGTVSTHVVKDNYKVVVNNDSLHVKGNVNIIVDGDYSLRVHGRMDITADEGEITILGADAKSVGDGARRRGETVTLTGHHHPYEKSGGVDADPEASGPPVK